MQKLRYIGLQNIEAGKGQIQEGSPKQANKSKEEQAKFNNQAEKVKQAGGS